MITLEEIIKKQTKNNGTNTNYNNENNSKKHSLKLGKTK